HVAPESPPTTQPAVASRPPLPRPHLPKSALETVIEDASSGKEIDFGDDTIESLQAIMDGPSEIKIKEEDEDSDEAYEKAVLASFEQAASKETNAVDFDSLNLKLNSLMKHINDVKKGLDGLEGHASPVRGAVHVPMDEYTLPFVFLVYSNEILDLDVFNRRDFSGSSSSHSAVICTPILTIIIAFSRLVTQLLGFSDGYVDDLTEINNMIGEIRINGTPVAFPWLSAPTPANIEPQAPQPSSVKQSPQYQQPDHRPEYAWPPPDAYTPHWGSDLPAGDEAMDADELI
ncbi:hypothetical protein LTR66_017745, partial [Elasticomyces elasticus]